MEANDPNPRMNRVRYQMRSQGLPADTPNPLRSGVHHRGYLPHVKREGASYFVTFRLADALPKEVLIRYLGEKTARLRALELRQRLGPTKGQAKQHADSMEAIERDYRQQVERYLDQGKGACHLRRVDIAEMICEALRMFDGQQYHLDEWVVMPNHVHLIIWPMPNFTLSRIMKSRKQYTATQANRMLGRVGERFWQPESFDRWIRDDQEKSRIRRYIRFNPVTAGLCSIPEKWPWSSAWRP